MNLDSLLILTLLAKIATGSKLSIAGEPLNIAISVTIGSRSHARYLLEILELLTSRGHSITYLCSEYAYKYSKGYNVSSLIVSDVNQDSLTIDWDPFTRKSPPFDLAGSLGKLIAENYAKSFPNYEKYYMEQKPDLIICDFFTFSCIDSAVKHSIPMIIGYQGLGFEEKKPYLTDSDGLEPTTIENYTFSERFYHGIIEPAKKLIKYYEFLSDIKRIREENGVPATIELSQFTNMGLRIANSYIGLENARSLPSHVYLIGPVLTNNLPPLSSDLQSFFNSHQKILYIAFGSYLKFKKKLSANLLEHFQKLLNDGLIDGVVWGGMTNTNMEEFPKTYSAYNIEYSTDSMLDGTHQQFKLLKWAPQEAILNHPHTKLFVTHGGLDSIQEAVHSGTPVLVVPHIGDQTKNAVLIKERGIGDYIEWPLDGDDLISQKFINLLDPSNTKLKAKLDQYQRISKLSSNRKLFAADLIETYAYSAKICRLSEAAKSFEIPCEVKPFLPLDQQISPIKANLIDVYLVAILLLLVTLSLIALVTIKIFGKLRKITNKKKVD